MVDAQLRLLAQAEIERITNATVMDKYWFGWAQIFVVTQVLFDRLPAGADWG